MCSILHARCYCIDLGNHTKYYRYDWWGRPLITRICPGFTQFMAKSIVMPIEAVLCQTYATHRVPRVRPRMRLPERGATLHYHWVCVGRGSMLVDWYIDYLCRSIQHMIIFSHLEPYHLCHLFTPSLPHPLSGGGEGDKRVATRRRFIPFIVAFTRMYIPRMLMTMYKGPLLSWCDVDLLQDTNTRAQSSSGGIQAETNAGSYTMTIYPYTHAQPR